MLRRWYTEDLAPFARLNADPEVMALLPSTLSGPESDELAAVAERCFESHGYGPWAVGVLRGPAFIGCVGISPADTRLPFAPAVEIGWRLSKAQWGKGYAIEAARASSEHGFSRGLHEIVSFTTVGNRRSRAVMERLGMRRDHEGDFEHPALPPGHHLRHHVLYRLRTP